MGQVFGTISVETPKFTLLAKKELYEIRKYEKQLVAQTIATSENAGFRTLANYIFGNNTSATSIAMTAPVIEQSESIAMTAPVIEVQDQNAGMVMQFILPSKYTTETIPTPKNEQVKVLEIPSRIFAVHTFSGWVSASTVKDKEQELRKALEQDQIKALPTEPLLAQYNPPWTLPFYRTNEIMIQLQDAAESKL